MRFLIVLMGLVFLFVGITGFGSINELETVETEGAIMLGAVMLEVPVEITVAPRFLIDSSHYDAQIVAMPQSPLLIPHIKSATNNVDNMHLTSGTTHLDHNIPHWIWLWPGVRQRAVLFNPFVDCKYPPI